MNLPVIVESLLKLKSGTFFQVVGLIFIVFTGVITANGVIQIFNTYIYEPLAYKDVQYKNLLALATETNIDFFRSKLGNATFINSYKSGLKEYIFVNKFYYVQAITDSTEKVIGYSVTTQDKNFTPRVPLFKNIQLGEASFLDLGKNRTPEWIISALGAHDFFYSEGYYQGNPGGYQTVFFSSSMAGYSNYEMYVMPPNFISPDLSLNFNSMSDQKLPSEVTKYLKTNSNTINTYTILSPFTSIKDIQSIRDGDVYMYLFGPNQNQVRLLGYSDEPGLFETFKQFLVSRCVKIPFCASTFKIREADLY